MMKENEKLVLTAVFHIPRMTLDRFKPGFPSLNRYIDY